MANENYEAGRVTIQHEYRFGEIEYWNLYKAEKQKIQDKYPSKPWYRDEMGKGNHKEPFDNEWWEDWKSYQKEITDLLLKPKGNFTKFLYEIRPARDMMPIDIWLRGAYNTETYMKTRNRKRS